MAGIYTIAPDRPFLDTLAHGLLAEVEGDPSALAEARVLLPTRRACRSLREAFVRQAAGRAMLLPAIQPIGEVEADELLLAGGLDEALLPALGGLRRRLLLAGLLRGLDGRIEHALRLAADLEKLLDDLQTERLPIAAVERIVPDALAVHWQTSREILRLLATHWPTIVEAEGVVEPAEHRHLLLTALARHWRHHPPPGRVVAAGSTGSIPATRALLEVVAALPQGAVVLPGLDRDLDERSWERLGPTHPQHGLKQLLAGLSVTRNQLEIWPAVPGAEGCPARVHLLRALMHPAAASPEGGLPAVPAAALAGLAFEEHPDLAHEAMAIALRMRGVLEIPGRTAALVTPDRHLARRVSVELRRWQVAVDDSAGIPLDQTPPGAFLLLCAHLVTEGATPVALLAALKHPLARGGEHPGSFRRRVRLLERRCLRGPRPAGGVAGVLRELARQSAEASQPVRQRSLEELRGWLSHLAEAWRPFEALVAGGSAPLADLLRAHLALAESLAADGTGGTGDLWAGEAGEAASSFVAELLEAGRDLAPIQASAYPVLLARLMAERTVRLAPPGHPRLAIWGVLEARLQHADLMILGGLNEGVWPGLTDPGPWLNRPMRQQLGLSPVERRIGQAAHDFAQAACAHEVVLSRAHKDAAGQPTVPSRWLVRLKILLEAGGRRAALASTGYATWAAALDHAGAVRPEPQPVPKPAVEVRPRALSVSDIGLWMRDPYALYAKRVLRLRPLDPLDADAGALERGKIIHEALERFVRAWPRHLPDDALARLLAIGDEVFRRFEHRPQVRALWWPRFEQIARFVIEVERQRRPALAEVLAEIEGEVELAGPAGRFRLNARADRLERQHDGTLVIVDYKTGQIPRPRDVASGLQPQLPLEALIAQAGGFDGLPSAEAAALRYWHLHGKPSGGEQKDAGRDRTPAEMAEAARGGLEGLIAHYDRPETGYPARWTVPTARFRGDYDHLARALEWQGSA